MLLISTDPAHSLSDAFRLEFGDGEPHEIPGVPNLSVMEVNPETNLQDEIKAWAEMAAAAGMDELTSKVSEFQEWLSGVPGIDEATALTSVIGHIEDGSYDTIVFDTAPTGHTLKLLQLPKILQAGLDKLQSWQAKIWDVWTVVKAGAGAITGAEQPTMSPAEMKEIVQGKLEAYKAGMEKIGAILKDHTATNFMIVCIAEFLSINESRRLLSELQRNSVNVSHVVVNQLVKGWVTDAEMPSFDALLARADPRPEEDELLRKIQASIELTNARGGIQKKYLGELKAFPEVSEHGLTVIELPLLAGEVTGPTNILAFSQKLVGDGYRSAGDDAPKTLEGWTPTEWNVSGVGEEAKGGDLAEARQTRASETAAVAARQFSVGDRVKIDGLANAAEYNGYTGKVVAEINESGRVGVTVIFKAARKRLSLKPANLTLVEEEEQRGEKRSAPGAGGSGDSNPLAGMLAGLMQDPDVQEALKNPKVKAAYDDVVANGMMAGMKYFGDPDCAPVIQKIVRELHTECFRA
eukprot:COSAG02_NODE_2554_length_8538_cov_46.619268_2_plen_522_part_00